MSKCRRSRTWEFFKTITNTNLAKCTLCGNEYKTSGNTTNLKDHLKRKHVAEYNILSGETESGIEETPETGSNSNTLEISNNSNAKRTRNSIKDYINRSQYYSSNSTRRKSLDLLYCRMIALDMEPLRKGEHEGFRDFVAGLDQSYLIPTTTTLKTCLIPNYFQEIKLKLETALASVKYIAMTTDMWTNKNEEGILAITSHFFWNGNLISPLLEAVKVEGRHTSAAMEEVVKDVLIKWQVRDKVVAIVTDNAASMVKLSTILQIRHVPCFAHTLNLTVCDAFALPNFTDIMKKCKDIVGYFHSSCIASDKLKYIQRQLNKSELKLIQQCPTRWNSAYAMLKRLFDVRQELTLAIGELEKAPASLFAEDFNIINDCIQLLEPFEVATNATSGEKFVTISYILPLIRGLSLKLSRLENDIKTATGQEIYVCLQKSITTRLKPYELRTAPILATILDPRFKKQGFKTLEKGDSAAQLLQREYTTFLTITYNRRQRQTQPERSSESETVISETATDAVKLQRNKERELLFPIANRPSAATTVTCPLSDAIIDIRQYLEKAPINSDSDKCVIDYWDNSNLDALKEFAKSYLCIPASSVPSERIFSKAGLIHSDLRNRLKAKHFNELLFLNQNVKFFETK